MASSPRMPHELNLSEVARRHSKGSVDIGQGSAEFNGQSTSRSSFQGHWNCPTAKSVTRPTAGGSNPGHELGGRRKHAAAAASAASADEPRSPVAAAAGSKFDGVSSMRADFQPADSASLRPRTSMRHKGSGKIIGGGDDAGGFTGQSTARSSYAGQQNQERRACIRREPQLHTERARFEGVSTMRQDYNAERAAVGSPRHPKTTARVDHIHLEDGLSGAARDKVESVTHHDYTAKQAERRPPATQARIDHIVIGDELNRSSKAVESVTHHDYTAKQAERRPPATQARIDHVVIGDGSKYGKDMESVQRHDFTGERGEVPQPSNTGRVDHVVIADGSQKTVERRSSIMSTSYRN